MTTQFVAIVSADWNECLAPCGPFDALVFHYPELKAAVDTIFRAYTGNAISLGTAADRILSLVPGGITCAQMDDYLDHAFETYTGVPELMQWCLQNKILFMINTTGSIGYFQRVWAKNLLPRLPVLSAHPMLRFPLAPDSAAQHPVQIFELHETQDKPIHTAAVANQWHIPYSKIILMGDSGGDGPHFDWGAAHGAYLIGCMTKPSLQNYCNQNGIAIDRFFGISPAQGLQKTPQYDYMGLKDIIGRIAL